MTPEALKIREYILNSAISDSAKNEILPLLGVIGTPGIKERILKILEIEGKAAELEGKFLDLDIDNPQGNVQQPAPAQPMATPVPMPPAPVAPPPPMPVNPPVPVQPLPQQTNSEDMAIKQLEEQLKQLQQK